MRAALVVGSGKFSDKQIPSLPYAIEDARDFYKAVTDARFGASDAISSRLLLTPPRADLLLSLGDFFRGLSPNSEFVLYFAGHGRRLPSGQWAFVCHDSNPKSAALTTLTYSDLTRLIGATKQTRGTLIFDTCFARSADSLIRGLRERGEQAAVQVEPPRSGIITIWACGAAEMSFEKGGHGLFSAWLLRAMQGEVDVGPEVEFLKAVDIVDWIRRGLRNSSVPEPFWPSFRSAGDTTELYLSRNPLYEMRKTSGRTSHHGKSLEGVTARLMQALGIEDRNYDPEDIAAEFDAARKRYVLTGAVPEGMSLLGASRLQSVKLLLSLCFGAFILAVIASDVLQSGTSFVIVGALCCILLLFLAKDAWTILLGRSRSYFFLLNRRGFCHGKTSNGTLSTLTVPWSSVTSVEEKFGNDDTVSITFHLPAASHELFWSDQGDAAAFGKHLKPWGGTLVFSKGEVLSTGGLDALRKLLRASLTQSEMRNLSIPGNASHLDRPIADVEPSAQSSRTAIEACLLVGVSTYESLQTLSAPVKDIDQLRRVFAKLPPERVAHALDINLWDFEKLLAEFSMSAFGTNALIFFSGHGIASTNEFYLAFSSTDASRLEETAFPVSRFADLFLEAKFRHLVLILDCCLSGRAGESLSLTPLALRSFEDFWERDKEGITLLAATGHDEFAFEFEAGGVFTEAIIRSVEQAARDQAEAISVAEINDSVSAYLSQRELPQHHSSFIGDTGSQIYLLSDLNSKAESDIKAQLANDLSDMERRQLQQLRAVADETKRAVRKHRERLMVSDDRIIVWSPGLSRLAMFFAGICGLFVSVPLAIEAAKSAMEGGGFLLITIFLALLASGLGLFALVSTAALLYAIRPWRGSDFVVLHTSGVIDSNGTFSIASSITGVYPSITERNGVKETSICIRIRDGGDRIIIPAGIYRHLDMNIYLNYAQCFVQYFRSNYDLEARSLLKHALESHYARQRVSDSADLVRNYHSN